jgi:dihydroneopterin triphosphate diphosphatase
MSRAPFQVLVIPYRQRAAGDIEYAVFSRADYACWQGIAGGGEDDETPLKAARRESQEEANLPPDCAYIQLDGVNSIPAVHFKDWHLWGDSVFVIPEYTFGVDASEREIQVSYGHKEHRWLPYEQAVKMLEYEGNRTALWELNQRLMRSASG